MASYTAAATNVCVVLRHQPREANALERALYMRALPPTDRKYIQLNTAAQRPELFANTDNLLLHVRE